MGAAVRGCLRRRGPRSQHCIPVRAAVSHHIKRADLFAWKFYREANEILVKGVKVIKSKALLQLRKSIIACQFADAAMIQKIKEFILTTHSPDELDEMASHFRNFDPNYSSGSA
jgi:hypothetical protein